MTDDVTLSPTEAMDLARTALMRVGMAEAAAAALARATLDAEMAGKRTVGFLHLTDYLRSLVDGRIAGRAEPLITSPVPAIMKCNAMGGVAQHGFSLAHEELVAKARTFGIAVFSLHNSYTTGELGWYAARLAEEGLVALAATNGPALMAGAGSRQPVYCTNPLAFAAPLEDGRLLLIDQASSMAAFVDIREAAARGKSIPDGWALDQEGEPTRDPFAAMQGALLAYGGTRGANIALWWRCWRRASRAPTGRSTRRISRRARRRPASASSSLPSRRNSSPTISRPGSPGRWSAFPANSACTSPAFAAWNGSGRRKARASSCLANSLTVFPLSGAIDRRERIWRDGCWRSANAWWN
ncbi:Ldh family oxidoreductase [Shinella zoogloeoides]|uniref:Ldh family oxidoreductase n=1 Tax=Shinella zoogloeoides TaxID=352475 RepID=UPI003D7C1C39